MNRIGRKSVARTAALLAVTSAGFGVAYSTASGADTDPAGALSLTPSPLTYDDVAPGKRQDKTVTITNYGKGATQVTRMFTEGRDRTSFAVVSETCSAQALVSKASCTAKVRFKPTKDGTLVGILGVRSSNACTKKMTLAGGGYTAPPAQTRAACQGGSNTVTTTTPGTTTTAPGTTTTTPGTTTTTPGATVIRPNSSSVASLSITATKCSSRRTVTLHIRPARKQGLRSAKVTLNGKVVRRFGKRAVGRTITTKVVLKGKPRARFHVTINATGTNGKKYKRSQYFVTCVAKKPGS